jgi:orotate phosphoribosyltransferase
VLIEDIVTTGGQVIEAGETLKAAGVSVEKVIVVIDRMEGARETIEGAGYKFEALFTTKDLGVV